MQQTKEESKVIETITVPKRVLEKVELGTEREGELQGKELDNQVAQLKNDSKTQNKKLEEKWIELIIKEFDMDRFRAIQVLRQNDGDLQKSIKYLVNN